MCRIVERLIEITPPEGRGEMILTRMRYQDLPSGGGVMVAALL